MSKITREKALDALKQIEIGRVVYNDITDAMDTLTKFINQPTLLDSELAEEAELQLNKARHYFKKLKRIEKVYEQDINTPMPSNKLEELKCIKSYFQIKSILEEGVDQDESN